MKGSCKRRDRVAGPLKECAVQVKQVDSDTCLRSSRRRREDTMLYKKNRHWLAAAGGHRNVLDIYGLVSGWERWTALLHTSGIETSDL